MEIHAEDNEEVHGRRERLGFTGLRVPEQEAAEVPTAAVHQPEPVEQGLLFFLNLNRAYQNFCDSSNLFKRGMGIGSNRPFNKQRFTSSDWCCVYFIVWV